MVRSSEWPRQQSSGRRGSSQAWLADVLARIADHKINDLAALLPWNWRGARVDRAA